MELLMQWTMVLGLLTICFSFTELFGRFLEGTSSFILSRGEDFRINSKPCFLQWAAGMAGGACRNEGSSQPTDPSNCLPPILVTDNT